MPNHVHLLITPAATHSCARLMQRLAQLHTQYMNRTHGRSGSLWEGRFRSCLVQAEGYLIACYRYIDSNPIRAGLCADAGDYLWSSYHFNGLGLADGDISPHERYQALGITPVLRRQAYIELFKTDPRYWRMDQIRRATNGNFALGDENFKRGLVAKLGRRVEPGKPGRPPVPDADERQLALLG